MDASPQHAPDAPALWRALQLCQRARHAAEDTLDTLRRELHAAEQALACSQYELEQVRDLSYRDGLTGLHNRLGFGLTAARTLAEHADAARGLCLLFIDLENLKDINDRFGHAVGDALLQQVGARLVHAARHEDRVCRHGGGEFLCLLPQVRREDHALSVARKLIDSVQAPLELGDARVDLRASVGIALYPSDGLTTATLIAHAATRMSRVFTTNTPTSAQTIPSHAPTARAHATLRA